MEDTTMMKELDRLSLERYGQRFNQLCSLRKKAIRSIVSLSKNKERR